jgi:hypothetical protein
LIFLFFLQACKRMTILKISFHLSSLLNLFFRGKRGETLGLLLLVLPWLWEAKAQERVIVEQSSEFGAFVVAEGGGTVTVSHEGDRMISGNIIPIDRLGQWTPLMFGIEAPLGAVVHIQNGPDVRIAGSNGGEMTVSLGESSHGKSFVSTVSPPDRTYVSISATLSAGLGGITSQGNYSGSLFIITFIEE